MIVNRVKFFLLIYSVIFRNFIFIEDLLDFYEVLINNYDKAAEGKVFCCGPNNPISISDLVEMIVNRVCKLFKEVEELDTTEPDHHKVTHVEKII